jgi:hypothetical protein
MSFLLKDSYEMFVKWLVGTGLQVRAVHSAHAHHLWVLTTLIHVHMSLLQQDLQHSHFILPQLVSAQQPSERTSRNLTTTSAKLGSPVVLRHLPFPLHNPAWNTADLTPTSISPCKSQQSMPPKRSDACSDQGAKLRGAGLGELICCPALRCASLGLLLF